MHFEMANGEDTISTFIRDVMTTFQLNSPTILYGGEEAPGICYSDQGLRCLSSEDQEGKVLVCGLVKFAARTMIS